ncbi:hypothetical protein FHX74_003671 [Friedmanniella endophytica]|uniref:DUF4386 family protein n=1 Tax=Microlunatus kandeliicorticis TaxID=1759536 RepID=A0A7W3IVT3_9ACTN|nr:hypothetical protein [Microlunatus kandeliicorticis]MBA8796030.1 hypothetical protein [Microlunatus kandeliicorticis]
MSAHTLGSARPTGPDPAHAPGASVEAVLPAPEPPPVVLHRPTPPAVALAVAGLLFALFPVLRPFAADAAGLTAADGWSSPAWLVAHLCAIVGYVAAGFGVLGLRDALAGFLGGRVAGAALAVWWAGAGLVLAALGAEAFGLGTLGDWIERTRQFDLVALGGALDHGQPRFGLHLAGLALLGVAGVLVALAVLRSDAMPPGAGVLFGLAFVAAPVQLVAPTWVQVLLGIVTALGCLVLALQLRRLGAPVTVATEEAAGDDGLDDPDA